MDNRCVLKQMDAALNDQSNLCCRSPVVLTHSSLDDLYFVVPNKFAIERYQVLTTITQANDHQRHIWVINLDYYGYHGICNRLLMLYTICPDILTIATYID